MTTSQLQRARQLLQNEFGQDWNEIIQTLGVENLTKRVGKDLTSFMAFPERGDGGKNTYRGNCSPKVVESIIRYVLDVKRYNNKDTSNFHVIDPMSGSGTTGDVAEKMGISHSLYDLNPNPRKGRGNWNALTDDLDESADLIFNHPPYDTVIRYSGRGNMWGNTPHPDDLSQCANYSEFLDKMNLVIRKLYTALRNDGRLALLVGDIRSRGEFHSMQKDIMRMGDFESFIVKGQYNCVSDNRTYRKPFIPIVTEYVLVYHKKSPILIPFTFVKEQTFSILKHDYKGLTWLHLIRSVLEDKGKAVELKELNELLEAHPKAKNNKHFKERIRATIYEHPELFVKENKGTYKLAYAA
ncbi:hypothetical protein M2146_002578 [Lachnospiraceae bacterium PF1-22]